MRMPVSDGGWGQLGPGIRECSDRAPGNAAFLFSELLLKLGEVVRDAGAEHAVVVRGNGDVFVCGAGRRGQLGLGRFARCEPALKHAAGLAMRGVRAEATS